MRSDKKKECLRLQASRLAENSKRSDYLQKEIKRIENELTPLRVQKNRFEQEAHDIPPLHPKSSNFLFMKESKLTYPYPDYVQLYEGLHSEIEDFYNEFDQFTSSHEKFYKELANSIINIINKKFPSLTVES